MINNIFEECPIVLDNFIFLGSLKTSDKIFDLEIPDEISKIKNEKLYDMHYYSLDENRNNFDLDLKGNRAFFYTSIDFLSDEKIAFLVALGSQGKIWLNGKNILTKYEENSSSYLSLPFSKGTHEIIIEFSTPYTLINIDIRLSKLQAEIDDAFLAFFSSNFVIEQNHINVIHDDYNCKEKNNFRFLLQPNNHLISPKKIIMRIFDRFDKLLYKKRISLNNINNINLDKYKNNFHYNQKLIYIDIQCCYDNDSFQTSFYIILKDCYKAAKKIINKARRLIDENQQTLNLTDKLQFESIFINMENYMNNGWDASLYWDIDLIKLMLKKIKKNNGKLDSFYYEPVVHERCYKAELIHELYFKSKLDLKKELIRLYIPNNYNSQNKYPLFINIAVVQYGYYSSMFRKLDNLDFIVADITPRGVTMGSYIGEASILENIDIIKKMYAINENKIYLLGYSNGAYGAYSIAQNHPSLFAGIFPLAGCPYLNNSNNLINTNVVAINSDYDSIFYENDNYEKTKSAFYNMDKYHEIKTTQYTHGMLFNFLTNKNVIQFLLDKEINQFPRIIKFRTERNCHNKSFWIQLHEIQFGENDMSIVAQIINQEYIKIYVNNSTGFSLTIPPQINKSNFKIEVNKKVYSIPFCEELIHFVNVNNEYKIFEKIPNFTFSRKGSGLLTIYLNSLRILIPKNCDSLIEKTAKNFSSPHTNGYIPQIYTEYPILSIDSIQQVIPNNNLIIIDDGIENSNISKLKRYLHIKTDKEGFEYKQIKKICKYCILQIIPNPCNSEFSILFIQTNDTNLLKKNLFTRRVIIPAYVYGLDLYWNNEALIFTNNEYYKVYEWGLDLVRI